MTGFTTASFAGAVIIAASLAAPARAEMVLPAPKVAAAVTVDGDLADWSGVKGITVPLKGNGKVDLVEMKAVIHGDMIYISARWADSTPHTLHKPYKWDEASKSYKGTKDLEDRFAISLAMSGDFSADKTSGKIFTADVWHWKASRSDRAGIAHDKMHVVSDKPFKKAIKFTTPDGKTVYVHRPSDKGDRLYRPLKHDVKDKDVMPRYEVNTSPTGSIADVRAKGVWRDGYWHLEMARKLNTGHDDDAVIPADGTILIAVAAFNDVDGRNHSTSEVIALRTGAKAGM